MNAHDIPANNKGVREDFRVGLAKRFRALRAAIRATVGYENDALRLKQSAGQITAGADDIRPSSGFTFRTDAEAKDAFLDWLDTQMDRGILESTDRTVIRGGEHYTARYIRPGYRRGSGFGLRLLSDGGVEMPDITDERVADVIYRPVSQQDLEALYTRTYDNLETVTQNIRTEVRRELTRGLSEGWNPRRTADVLAERVDVGIADAERLARTETRHAVTQGSLRQYRQHNVKKVNILGTSPCPEICAPIIDKNPYKIDNIPRGGPPFHPNCLGAVAPIVEDTYESPTRRAYLG